MLILRYSFTVLLSQPVTGRNSLTMLLANLSISWLAYLLWMMFLHIIEIQPVASYLALEWHLLMSLWLFTAFSHTASKTNKHTNICIYIQRDIHTHKNTHWLSQKVTWKISILPFKSYRVSLFLFTFHTDKKLTLQSCDLIWFLYPVAFYFTEYLLETNQCTQMKSFSL